MDQGIAIDLTGGSQEQAALLDPCKPQCLVGSKGAHLQGLYGIHEIIDGAGGAGQVKDESILREIDVFGDIVVDELEILPARKVSYVVDASRQQVVKGDNPNGPSREACRRGGFR